MQDPAEYIPRTAGHSGVGCPMAQMQSTSQRNGRGDYPRVRFIVH